MLNARLHEELWFNSFSKSTWIVAFYLEGHLGGHDRFPKSLFSFYDVT